MDFDAGLNFCIRQIRRILGDNARRPRLLETEPGRGYRFIGELETMISTQSPTSTLGISALMS